MIIEPIFVITDNVRKLSKGTSFAKADSDRIEKCQETWGKSRSLFKSFLADFKQIVSSPPGTVVSSNIVDSLKYLYSLLESLFSEIWLLTELREASSSESAPSSTTENDNPLSGMKNVTAMNVLLRLKSKLEGRSGFGERRTVMSVNDQVDELITTAMNPENLCQMYEGWMSWI